MDRTEKAIALHKQGYNCCQAVALAFEDVLGKDKETIYKLCEGFGFGMGGSFGACGALSGAVMLAGLENSDGKLSGGQTKKETYALSGEMYRAFSEKVGSTVCREIKDVDSGEKILCSCDDCIKFAVEIAQKVLHL